MYWFGVILSLLGILSVIILGRIFYKYHSMYPWFDGLQPWITGYYLLPVGIYLLSTRWMFLNDVISYNINWVDSGYLLALLVGLFGVSIVFQYYFKKVMVVAGQIESEDKELPDSE